MKRVCLLLLLAVMIFTGCAPAPLSNTQVPVFAPLEVEAAPAPDPTPSPLPEKTPQPSPEPTQTPQPENTLPPLIPASEPRGSRYIDPDAPMIALTFDDGPSQYTPRILDALDAVGGRATFFMQGYRMADNGKYAAAIVEQGSEIANHTESHKNLKTSSSDLRISQIDNASDLIEAACGVRPTLLRPPGGSYNDEVCALAAQRGLAIIMWSVDPRDWDVKDADAVYNHVIAKAEDGAIVLSHDIYSTTAQAYERLIPELAECFQLVTVSELLNCRAAGGVPGNVYRNIP